MIAISNIYGHRFDSRLLSHFQALGFRIRPQASKYAGAQLCRFIDFEHGPSLELIKVEDDQAYRDFVPDGMDPYCPGISLALPQAGRIKDYEQEFQHLHPYRLHVNYDGSSGSLGPGWNYLNFAVPVVAKTFIWLTAYDEPKPVEPHIALHPDTVKGIEGLVFDLEMDSLNTFRRLVNEETANSTFRISEVTIWSRDVMEGLGLGHDKQFPLVAVVLRADKLDYFPTDMEGVRRCSFMGHSAVHIATNKCSWDVVVIV